MIPIQISLKNKKVLIVGGGKVALRKAKLFLKETCHVTVLAPSIHKELIEYGCQGIHKYYESSDLIDYFLVYACSNDKELNHRIVCDCNDRNILCGSATYDESCSFYSMGFIESDIGTIGLSMNQSLPYHKPLLNEMNQVLDSHRDRIQLMYELRPYVLTHVSDKQSYFDLLFKCPVRILEYLVKIQDNKGYLYIYHTHSNKENIELYRDNSLLLSISELEEYKALFECFNVVIVPLILCDGYIYNKIKKILPDHTVTKPILNTIEDLKYLIKLYECDRNMIYIVHPSYNVYIKDTMKSLIRDNDRVIDFDEELDIDIDKEYRCVLLLMTHGKHYSDFIDLFAIKKEEGYNIEYMNTLLENKVFMSYIEDKIDKEV